MPFARYFCIFINVGLGEAAKRDVGTGDNQIPDSRPDGTHPRANLTGNGFN